MIYLDNAATTKLHSDVLAAMIPYMIENYGNAGASYRMGTCAAKAIAASREQVAAIFGAAPSNIIFTSGGSEGNSMVFAGLRRRLTAAGKTHLIVSAIEHDSVLRAAEALVEDGFSVTYLPAGAGGKVFARAVEDAIRENTGLVSVMHVNNETGAINDIRGIGDICRVHSVLFHTDCVQAAGQYPLDVDRDLIDFATVSAHKFHGPKGIGALYARDPALLDPLIRGGSSQEFGLRGGTENVPAIVGIGCAAEIAVRDLRENMAKVSTLKQVFYTALLEALRETQLAGCVSVNGPSVVELGKVLNLRIDGVDAETLIYTMDIKGVEISAGSACNTRESVPSHVLKAMGLSDEDARSSVRISFSAYNTEDEAVQAAHILADCIALLKDTSAESKE